MDSEQVADVSPARGVPYYRPTHVPGTTFVGMSHPDYDSASTYVLVNGPTNSAVYMAPRIFDDTVTIIVFWRMGRFSPIAGATLEAAASKK